MCENWVGINVGKIFEFLFGFVIRYKVIFFFSFEVFFNEIRNFFLIFDVNIDWCFLFFFIFMYIFVYYREDVIDFFF